MAERFDFVVIGSGAGGAAAAARLAEGGARVLLAEKGPEARTLRRPAEALARYYTDEGLAASTGNCLLPIPTGSVLGGTTKINSGTCLRTPQALLSRWQQRSGGRFDAAAFGRSLDDAWRRLKVKPVPAERLNASTRMVFRGLEKLDIRGAEPLHRAEDGCEGSGRCCFVCPKDAKQSADLAFLSPLKGKPELEIRCGTTLAGLEPVRGGVRVALSSADGRREVAAGAAVLACGSLRTPAWLRRLGVSGAGDGLSLHPAAKVHAVFDAALDHAGGVPQDGGLVDPEQPRIRYEGITVPRDIAAMSLPVEGKRLRWWMDRHDRTASFGFMIQDSSRGTVREAAGLPLIRYRMNGEDLALMLRGMRFVARAFFAAGARAVMLPLNVENNVFESAAELEAAGLSAARASQLQMMAFHPLGTCGMGRVVDWDLKAAEGVYVADGSVVPESLGVNPQVTISAFALRLAEHLLGGRREG